jgi:hypothetical protein
MTDTPTLLLMHKIITDHGFCVLTEPMWFKRMFAEGQEIVVNDRHFKVCSCSRHGDVVVTIVEGSP